MARYENNINRSYPIGQNLHRRYGIDDYESEGNYTSKRLPHENDNGSFRRDAWEKIDHQETERDVMGRPNDGYRGYYGDTNQFEESESDFSAGINEDWNRNTSDFSEDFSRNINQRRQRFEERGGHYGKGPRGWKRSDERIREDVNEALFRSYDVDASDLEVAVLEGVVTLTGTVKNRKEKREAEFCAEAVSGVSDVRNEIQIQR